MSDESVTIKVYIDDSRIFTYGAAAASDAERAAKARDHIHAIARQGLVIGPKDGKIEFIPPHRISKITAIGDFKASNYQGSWEGA